MSWNQPSSPFGVDAVTTEPLKSSSAGAMLAGKLSTKRPSSWALFVDQRQMIPPASAGARGVVERPEIDGAAADKADFAEHAVDRDTRQSPERRNDRLEQRAQEFIGRAEDADAPARERPIDRQHGEQRRLAPPPSGHQRHPSMRANEIERLELRRMRRNLGQDDGAARRVLAPVWKSKSAATPSGRPPMSREHAPATLPASSVVRPEGRPRLSLEPLRGEYGAPFRSNARANVGSPPCRKSAATSVEIEPTRRSARLSVDGALRLNADATLMRKRSSSARCFSTSASSSAALAPKNASRPATTRLPCSPSISALAIIDVILAIASRASWAVFGGSRSIGCADRLRWRSASDADMERERSPRAISDPG